MGFKRYTEEYIQDIADAIRAKKGVTTKYKTQDMANAISSIESGENIIYKIDPTFNTDDPYTVLLDYNILNENFDTEFGFTIVKCATRTQDFLIRIYMNGDYLRFWLSNGSGNNGWFGCQYGGNIKWQEDLQINDKVRVTWDHTTKHIALYINDSLITDVDCSTFWETLNVSTSISNSPGVNGKIKEFYIKKI